MKNFPKLEFSRITYGLLLSSAFATVHAGTVTPDADGQWKIKCECLGNFSFCQNNLLATAAGKPVQSWYQDVFVTKDVAVDLNAACYRKRDTDAGGAGQCCSIAGDEAATIKNLFNGTKH